MPIYEFYCQRCHRVYNFFSPRVNTEKIPLCPRCGDVQLKRQMSVVARISKRGSDAPGDDADLPFDPERMERAMAMLSQEAEGINEDDPRQAASLMRKLSEAAGLKFGPAMEEALNRLEKGEDPESLEEEMGQCLENEGDLFELAKRPGSGKRLRPEVDDTLYDL